MATDPAHDPQRAVPRADRRVVEDQAGFRGSPDDERLGGKRDATRLRLVLHLDDPGGGRRGRRNFHRGRRRIGFAADGRREPLVPRPSVGPRRVEVANKVRRRRGDARSQPTAMPSVLRSAKYCSLTEKTSSSFIFSAGGRSPGSWGSARDDLLGDLEVGAEEQSRAARRDLDGLHPALEVGLRAVLHPLLDDDPQRLALHAAACA